MFLNNENTKQSDIPNCHSLGLSWIMYVCKYECSWVTLQYVFCPSVAYEYMHCSILCIVDHDHLQEPGLGGERWCAPGVWTYCIMVSQKELLYMRQHFSQDIQVQVSVAIIQPCRRNSKTAFLYCNITPLGWTCVQPKNISLLQDFNTHILILYNLEMF